MHDSYQQFSATPCQPTGAPSTATIWRHSTATIFPIPALDHSISRETCGGRLVGVVAFPNDPRFIQPFPMDLHVHVVRSPGLPFKNRKQMASVRRLQFTLPWHFLSRVIATHSCPTFVQPRAPPLSLLRLWNVLSTSSVDEGCYQDRDSGVNLYPVDIGS